MADTTIVLINGATVTTHLTVEDAADLVAAAAQRNVMMMLTSPRSDRKTAINPDQVVAIRAAEDEY